MNNNIPTIAQQYREYLQSQGKKIAVVMPAEKGGRDKYDLKIWWVEGFPRLLSDRQLYRLATQKCPVCTRRFIRTRGRGRKRKYCSNRCKTRASRHG